MFLREARASLYQMGLEIAAHWERHKGQTSWSLMEAHSASAMPNQKRAWLMIKSHSYTKATKTGMKIDRKWIRLSFLELSDLTLKRNFKWWLNNLQAQQQPRQSLVSSCHKFMRTPFPRRIEIAIVSPTTSAYSLGDNFWPLARIRRDTNMTIQLKIVKIQ